MGWHRLRVPKCVPRAEEWGGAAGLVGPDEGREDWRSGPLGARGPAPRGGPPEQRPLEPGQRTIWSYWAQGPEEMPELFRLCVETWRRLSRRRRAALAGSFATAARRGGKGPVCFGLTLATILQLGSTSVVSGVCIEFGSLLMELRFKYCLLSGTTPLQSLRDRLCCLGRCCSHRKTGRMSFVHPGFDDIVSLDPTVLGAQQAGSGERAGETHGDAGPCSETLDNDGPEKCRRHLLATIVAYYNIVGAVAQVTVAGFLIVAKVQPNKSWSAPLPPSQILALVGLRLAFEVLGDMAITAVAHCYQPKGAHALAEARRNLGWQGLTSVCFLAVIWSAEAMMLYMTYLCPVPVQRGAVDPFTVELLALGLCPHRSHLLQLS
ncbi:unnamed protein product [Prorocentrum cordatum]|uniref:Solute carrier family 40 protein n=1 Tax=Prorocentrum cordatum TaxID=2364126 RepID=A0ABN9RYL6_9DINO|nr:unnamed protein product [Polarella glacialis]